MKTNELKKGIYAAVFTMAAVQTNAGTSVDFSNLVENVSPAVVSVNVVKKMPKWIPGKQNGRAVPVYFTLPIVFRLKQ